MQLLEDLVGTLGMAERSAEHAKRPDLQPSKGVSLAETTFAGVLLRCLSAPFVPIRMSSGHVPPPQTQSRPLSSVLALYID